MGSIGWVAIGADGAIACLRICRWTRCHRRSPHSICTWHRLLGKEDDFRKNPRRVWYANVEDVTVDDDYQATFHLSKPQPALIMLLGSGMAPVYHVPAKDMRTHPIGTGPFKFFEFK